MIRPQSHLMPGVGYGPILFGVLGMDYTDDPAVGEQTSHRATRTNLLLHIRSTDDVGRVPITGHIMHSDGSGTALLICLARASRT